VHEGREEVLEGRGEGGEVDGVVVVDEEEGLRLEEVEEVDLEEVEEEGEVEVLEEERLAVVLDGVEEGDSNHIFSILLYLNGWVVEMYLLR